MKKYLLIFYFLIISGCNTGPDVNALLAGDWEYRQGHDSEGEIIHFWKEGDAWFVIMNGLERAEEHGLFYYVSKAENLVIESDGRVSFFLGTRDFHRTRPTLNDLSVSLAGDGGGTGDPMYFQGKIENNQLILECKDRHGSCPDSTLLFKKNH